ncbi:MAG: NADH-quinone oxidoreductase subunit NuoK [Planctomycetota bacterium]|nr:NADH-quinone oxidoreductase subunit NuoK [Planctomycetota bacterium]
MSGTVFSPASCAMLASVLFGIGAFGIVSRRNLIVVLVAIEIMLNAANLAFVSFARLHADGPGGGLGQAAALFIMALAAAEAAVGLAIVLAIYRSRGTATTDGVDVLRG